MKDKVSYSHDEASWENENKKKRDERKLHGDEAIVGTGSADCDSAVGAM